MKIIARGEWGARPPRYRTAIRTPTSELWLHHAAGAVLPGDNSVSASDLRRIRSIQDYHMDRQGWSDIAYSFLLDPDGNIFEGRGAGMAGGHTRGRNTISHGICVMGHYDRQTPESGLPLRLAELVRHGAEKGWWLPYFTGGHRDVSATSCPGSRLYPLIGQINEAVQNPMASKIKLTDWARPTFAIYIERGWYTEETNIDKVRETYEFQQQTVNQWRALQEMVGQAGGGPTDHDHDGRYIKDLKEIR